MYIYLYIYAHVYVALYIHMLHVLYDMIACIESKDKPHIYSMSYINTFLFFCCHHDEVYIYIYIHT